MQHEVTDAAATVMEETQVREAWMNVIKCAVIDALNDAQFMAAITDTVKVTLQDTSMYSSAAKGALGALNPFKNKDSVH